MRQLKKILWVGILLLVIIINLYLIHSLTIDSVAISDEIKPGEIARISIGIKNDGDNDIEDINIALDLTNAPFAPFNSASENSISEIEENKIKYTEFEIIALNNAKSGNYKISLLINYKDGSEKKTKNSLISLTVNSKPIIDISVEEGLFIKNEKNEIVFKINNKGISSVKFLDFFINRGVFELLSPDKYYIGDIDSNDFETVKVKFFFGEEADFVNIPIKAFYKDDLNNEYKEEFNLKLKVYSKKEAIKLDLLERDYKIFYLIFLALIILAYILYKVFRKRLKKQDY